MTCDSLIDRSVTNQDWTIDSVHVHKKANSSIAAKIRKCKIAEQLSTLYLAGSVDDRSKIRTRSFPNRSWNRNNWFTKAYYNASPNWRKAKTFCSDSSLAGKNVKCPITTGERKFPLNRWAQNARAITELHPREPPADIANCFTMEKWKIGKRAEDDRNNNLVTRREFLQSFIELPK